MNEASLVAERAVGADEHLAGNGLPKHLDLERVSDDLLRLAVDVGVHERDIVVARNHVAERRKALLNARDGDRVGERVAEMLHLLIGRRAREKETMAVANHKAANDARAGNARVNNRDSVAKLSFKNTVKVLRATDANEAVRVGQARKHTNLIAILKLTACEQQLETPKREMRQ